MVDLAELATDELPFQIAPPLPHVRPYRDEDAAELARLFRESSVAWPGGGPAGGLLATPDVVRTSVREANLRQLLLAWAPDKESGRERAVGYCWSLDFPSQPKTGYISLLGAHQDFHGGGFG